VASGGSAFDGNLDSGVRRSFCVCAFCRNVASCCVDVFTFYLLCKTFYRCCSFNAICEDNTVISCVAVQHKDVSFPSILSLILRC
jgi:hypothetical protein